MKLLYSLLFLLPLQSFSQSDTLGDQIIYDRDYFMQQDVQIRSSRGPAPYYYIDGVKVYGNPDTAKMNAEVASIICGLPRASTLEEPPQANPPLEPPVQAIEQVEVITGGIPGTYGDINGPVVIREDSCETQVNDLCINRIPAEEIEHEPVDSCVAIDPYPIQFRSGRSSAAVVKSAEIIQYQPRGCCSGAVYSQQEPTEVPQIFYSLLTGTPADQE